MLQSRRGFLIGAGAVLSTAFPEVELLMTIGETAPMVLNADLALLASLTSWERDIVQQAMANHPAVTLAESIEMLKAFGM